METFFIYLLLSSSCLSIGFLIYKIFFRKDTQFKLQRFMILSIAFIALAMPFHRVSFDLPELSTPVKEMIPVVINMDFDRDIQMITNTTIAEDSFTTSTGQNSWTLILCIYIFIAIILSIRLLIQNLRLSYYIKSHHKTNKDEITIVFNERYPSVFSWFNYVLVNQSDINDPDIETIIAHEQVHIHQKHYLDKLFFEILAILMWFNPFLWMMKRTLYLTHEYLADDGVIAQGKDRLFYQTLLINQVAEGRLLGMVSAFSRSLVKKRLLMLGRIKSNRIFRIFSIIPLSVIMFLMIACTNKNISINEISAIELPETNTLFLGIENKVDISVSGYNKAELDVSVDQGSIFGSNGNYLVTVDKPGHVILTVKYNKEVIQKIKYPVADKSTDVNDIIDPLNITPEFWMEGLNITENEYLQFVYWVMDSISAENDKIPVSMNVLYTGINNYIKIPVANKKNINVTIDHGTIKKKEDYFIVRVNKPGKANICVYIDEQLVQKKEFTVIKPDTTSDNS